MRPAFRTLGRAAVAPAPPLPTRTLPVGHAPAVAAAVTRAVGGLRAQHRCRRALEGSGVAEHRLLTAPLAAWHREVAYGVARAVSNTYLHAQSTTQQIHTAQSTTHRHSQHTVNNNIHAHPQTPSSCHPWHTQTAGTKATAPPPPQAPPLTAASTSHTQNRRPSPAGCLHSQPAAQPARPRRRCSPHRPLASKTSRHGRRCPH